MAKTTNFPIAFTACTVILLTVSFFFAFDKFTWVLEVFPILIAFPVLFFTYKQFPLTPLIYILLLIHFLIICVGGIYTYAEVPLGYWMQDWFGFSRNNYDKIGHFAQGFIPAILIREILIRKSSLQQGNWLNFIVVCICLAFSALYELIEWWVALLHGASAEAFLGTQGFEWDAQSDMFLALIGAILALCFLSSYHNRKLRQRKFAANQFKVCSD